MIEWIIIGGILVAAVAAGGVMGYAASRRRYHWTLAYDPYWNTWVWVPIFF